MVKNCYYWSKMVQYGSKMIQWKWPKYSKTILVKLSDNRIHSNILDKYIHSQKYLLIFSRANLFGYSFVIFLSCRIYSDIHSSNIYGNEFIRIFIRPKNWYSSHTAPVHPVSESRGGTLSVTYTGGAGAGQDSFFLILDIFNLHSVRSECQYSLFFKKKKKKCYSLSFANWGD